MFFHALTFAGSRGSCLNMRPQGRVFKHLPGDLANVNAMKQKCDCYSYILPNSNIKSHQKRWKNIKKIVFCTLDLFVQDSVIMKIECQRHHFC